MVSAPPLSPLVKWTLPLSLLVTALGLWWHSSRKKPKPPGETVKDKEVEPAPLSNGTVKANGVNAGTKLSHQIPQTDNPDLNAFIETVYKLNAGTLDSPVEKPIANGNIANGNIANGWTHSTPKQETAVCTSSVKAQAPTTPVTARSKRSTPQPCTPPSVEKQVVAKSVKYLESSESVLNSLEFGVAKIEDKKKKSGGKKSPSPPSPAKKTWSELVEEDSESEEVVRASATEDLLQFRIEHLVSSSDVTRSAGTDATLTSSSSPPSSCCDSTTVDSTFSNSPPDYRNTKSYSESAANAEIVNIITQQSGGGGAVATDAATSDALAARDSANHSPSGEDLAVMVCSPSLSDVHSEGSSDSGKGGSEASSSRTPSSTHAPTTPTPAAPASSWVEHHFVLPQHIVGRLIGKAGAFIHRVRTTTLTKMYIKRHPHSHKLKICAVEGTQENVDQALAMIRQKFPLSLYPFLTLEKVPYLAPDTISCTLRPEPFQLTLVEGINNDVCISSLMSAGHFFVQLPSHPSYASLESLNLLMNTTYSSSQAPLLPAPVENALVAAPAMGGWFRGQIIAVDTAAGGSCQVRFVDYGGYASLQARELRQIRADFLALPFQAIECGLANVLPPAPPTPASTPAGEGDCLPEAEEAAEWSEEARQVVHGFTSGHILQAQVYDYDVTTAMPLVYLYTLHDSEIVLVNQELVARGLARLDPQAEHLVATTDATSTDSDSKVSPPSISSADSTPEAAVDSAAPDVSSSSGEPAAALAT